MKQMLTRIFVGFTFLSSMVSAEKQELTFDDTQSLVVTVSRTGLTRLSVKGDRLREVIGLDDTVVVEKDDTNGHLFLKGIKEKQNITVVTEGGDLQDLTLVPGGKGSTTIVLTSARDGRFESETMPHTRDTLVKTGWDSPRFMPSYTVNAQDKIIELVKQMFAGLGTSIEKPSSRKTETGCEVVSERYLRSETLVGEVFTVTNTNSNTTIVLEKDFYQPGDLALALGKKQLLAGESTILFVIRAV